MQHSFYIWHKHFSYNFLVDILITAILKTLLQLAAQLTVSGQRKMEEKFNVKLTFNLQVSLKDVYFNNSYTYPNLPYNNPTENF